MLAYLYFYNPLRFLWALVRPKSKLYLADSGMQVIGMWGAAQTIRRTLGWAFRLKRGPIERQTQPPHPAIPIREVGRVTAAERPHARRQPPFLSSQSICSTIP